MLGGRGKFSRPPGYLFEARGQQGMPRFTSGDGHDRGVEFPDRLHMDGAAVVVKIFKSHAQDVYQQGLRQFTAMLGIELKGVFRQLGCAL